MGGALQRIHPLPTPPLPLHNSPQPQPQSTLRQVFDWLANSIQVQFCFYGSWVILLTYLTFTTLIAATYKPQCQPLCVHAFCLSICFASWMQITTRHWFYLVDTSQSELSFRAWFTSWHFSGLFSLMVAMGLSYLQLWGWWEEHMRLHHGASA